MKKSTKEELLPGGVTQAQLDAWKRDNPEGVHTLNVTIVPEEFEMVEKEKDGKKVKEKKVTKEAEVATIYLTDPFNKPEVITEAMGKDTKHEMQDYILGRLFLGGDKNKVFGDKKARYWASIKAYRLIEVNEVEVKKA